MKLHASRTISSDHLIHANKTRNFSVARRAAKKPWAATRRTCFSFSICKQGRRQWKAASNQVDMALSLAEGFVNAITKQQPMISVKAESNMTALVNLLSFLMRAYMPIQYMVRKRVKIMRMQ